jgi:hypothetical protein
MRQGAIDVATAQVEYDRNLPWANIGVYFKNGASNVAGSPGGGAIPATQTVTNARGTYTVTTAVSWAYDSVNSRPSYKKVTVSVAWSNPTPGTMAVETAIYMNGASTNLGDVQIICRDTDNPTVRLANINVELTDYSGSVMIGTSASDGTILYSPVATGKATFTAPSFLPQGGGYLVDPTSLGTPTIVVGFQNVGFVECQKPCTAVIHVHSSTITNYQGATVTLKDLDRSITYTAVTDANGNATFTNLWKSKTLGYTATAVGGSSTSPAGTFSLTVGGQNYTGLDLALPDPASILVSLKASTTGAAITGKTWNLTLKNPSGTVVGTYSGTASSYLYLSPVAGTYTASVTGVAGFQDNTSFAFTANTTGANQACVVPLSPLFLVTVRCNGSGVASPTVTVTNATSGTVVASISGTTTANSSGQISYIIPADGTYNVVAVVNGLSYTGSQATLVAASPPTTSYYLDISPGVLTVSVSPGATGWTRPVGVYNAAKALVATSTVTVASPSSAFSIPGGMYTVVVGGTSSPAWASWPTTLPSNLANTYKQTALTSPGLPIGGTYSVTALAAN